MKNLLLRARDVDRTSKIKISRRRLTEYVEIFHRKECRTCSMTTNQSIGLWRCRCRCRRHFLGPVQTSNFTCAESNANERKQ